MLVFNMSHLMWSYSIKY